MKKCCILMLIITLLMGLVPAQAAMIAFDTPPLPGESFRQLLQNPNRGFRLETYLSVGSNKLTSTLYNKDGEYLGAAKGQDAQMYLIDRVYAYKQESPMMVQVYFYLTEYRDRDLDQVAFTNMNDYLQTCRNLGVTVSLRFSYIFTQYKEGIQDVVSLEQMLRHMEQLKPFIQENRDVLFCLEAGFVGPWGEWHTYSPWVNGNEKTIINAIVNMCPEDLPIVVRNGWIRELVAAGNRHRVGYHDDYVLGYSHGWSVGGNWNTKDFKQIEKNSPRVLVKGEMPWGDEATKPDAWGVAKYMNMLHFTALSCYHNYREGGFSRTYTLSLAKQEAVTADILRQKSLAVPYDAWFQKKDGQAMNRNLFEYIRDFLGYHLQVKDAAARVNGNKVELAMVMTNYGFAAPLAMKDIEAVLVDEAGNIVARQSLCKLEKLQSGEAVPLQVSLDIPEGAGKLQAGIYLYDFAGKGAKLANDIPFENGVNILGAVN
ncbi:MAG: DUF4874 domain-containing protein [Clostridiales bacterium]|nr:DUF4874 domain-containing protein [Clostridiales bacterium]